MQNLRLFLAIDPPEDTVQKIVVTLNSLIDLFPNKIKWVEPGNIHLTLKFLGDVAEDKIYTIIDEVRLICAEQKVFDMTMGKLSIFPPRGKARILWIGIENSARIIALAKTLDMKLGVLGFAQETRPFSPHITLGRIKDNFSQKDCIPLKNHIVKEKIEYGSFSVRSIHLFKSQLRPTGPIYTRIQSVDFL